MAAAETWGGMAEWVVAVEADNEKQQMQRKSPSIAVGFCYLVNQERFVVVGGDEEDRTPDLRIANATLSQLSYVPTVTRC